MAAMGIALWKYVMRYSPENPNYFNRDRFVLSNGKLTNRRAHVMSRISSISYRSRLSVSICPDAPCRL